MNSEIDLKHFGPGGASPGTIINTTLVKPPRRIISRYVLPLILLAGFVAVGLFAFRGSLVKPTQVMVTMPVFASDKIQASLSAMAPAGKSNDKKTVMKKALFQAPGWIEPEPYPIVIPSLRMGTVKSIEVIEGESVTSGAVIARLVDEDERLAVDSAESTLKMKQAAYQATLANWKNPTSLTEAVKTAAAKQDKLEAEARRLTELLELARIEAKIGNTLQQGGYEASLETIRKETQLSASRNQLAETQAEIKLTSATLDAATERLALRIDDREHVETAHAELMAAQTALEMAQLQLDRSIIRAPMDGTIMRLMVSPGSMLSGEMANGLTIGTLYQPSKLQVRVDVPLSEAAKVMPGLDAEIKVEALPDKRFRGELINIVPEFDLQKNVLPVKVKIYDPDAALRPEMIARVEFFKAPEKSTEVSAKADEITSDTMPGKAVGAADSVLLIPTETIIADAGKSHVMIAGPDGLAHRLAVDTGDPIGEMTPVIKGLRISDKVIIKPGSLEAGNPVQIKGFMEHGSH